MSAFFLTLAAVQGRKFFKPIALVAIFLSLSGFGPAMPTARGDNPSSTPNPPPSPAERRVLPWIAGVVKMNDAGVPADTIGNFIRASASRSVLTADDIIYLQKRQVPSMLINAMIEHGNSTATVAGVSPPQPTPARAQQYAPPPTTYTAPPVATAAPYPQYAYGYPPDYSSPYYYYYYDYYSPYSYFPGFFLPYTAIVTGGFRDRDHDRFFHTDRADHRFFGPVGRFQTPVGQPITRGGTPHNAGSGGNRGNRR